MPELMTPAEREVVALLGRAYTLLANDVVAHGATREADLSELCAHIHAVQHAVMGQAAGRAYPQEFRLLGETIT